MGQLLVKDFFQKVSLKGIFWENSSLVRLGTHGVRMSCTGLERVARGLEQVARGKNELHGVRTSCMGLELVKIRRFLAIFTIRDLTLQPCSGQIRIFPEKSL